MSSSLDLKELERKLDKALSEETPESLMEWLNNKHKSDPKNPQIIFIPDDDYKKVGNVNDECVFLYYEF